MLKQDLLNTGYFINNEYLDQYLQLVAKDTTEVGYTESHHILQKQYFKIMHLPIDSSINNKVKLLYKDHCLAHYLLYFCTIEPLKSANSKAINKMFRVIKNTYKKYRNNVVQITTEDLQLIQNYMNKIYNDPNSEFYSNQELTILIENYNKLSLKELKKLLPNRSIQSIQSKATKDLHLKSGVVWTSEQDNILIKYYHKEGKAIMKRLPNRTWKTITTRANYLNLHVKNYWTQEDISILIKYYPKEKGKVINRLKNRTINNIYSKVKELKKEGLL